MLPVVLQAAAKACLLAKRAAMPVASAWVT